ncbi:hypothetical protein BN863_16130 [Formosa agariphila KMM 3901]|uniref:Uncharacterized protein n=1 Tax=Formosa agariphila (strain DSM 15362 / KCTC 12365 / LMG 23005 / KMM 3901 / M-2Alg 35-1) TaxID=1347342 RepID=T2KKR5_FORAG|nr:hypothetical protein BN863_16130 [Formosa agariphila KMM 3901]
MGVDILKFEGIKVTVLNQCHKINDSFFALNFYLTVSILYLLK